MNIPYKILAVLVVSLYIAACGGGGGSSSGGGTTTVIGAAGTVSASSSSAVDSDVNDTNASYTSNDSFASAQTIPNPVTLGGYLNRPGTGSSGRSYASGDTNDYYTADLLSGQVITLLIGDTQTGNLDLVLYDSLEAFVDNSAGTGQSESVTVPSDGTYYVRILAASGYSNYVLSIGQSTSSAGADAGPDPDEEFVPGEIIVRFKKDVSGGGNIKAAKASFLGFIRKAGSEGRAELLGLGGADNRMKILSRLGIKLRSGSRHGLLPGESEISGLKRETIDIIKALRKRDDVLYADPNYIRRPSAVPDDTYYSLQWHYPLINLPQAWEITTGSSSVIVAVIDTGVLLDHPDLQGQLVSGYDFIISDSNSLDQEPGIDNNPDDPGDEGAGGSSFHGTHVAGTVAAATDNAKGVAGTAWGVKIMPVRVLGKSGGTSYDLIQSIKFAAGIANDSGTLPAQAADIINMSLGGTSSSSAEQDAITEARNAGVIIVAAAGNSNSSTPDYPAAYNGVVSVSAVDINKNRAYYSNYGSSVDVAAPGGDLTVDLNGDGYYDGVLSSAGDDSGGSIEYIYAFNHGTSMATPHIAGVAALMKSVNSSLTPDQFDSLLSGQTGDGITEDIGTAGRDDEFGYGLIDAYKAVNEAQSATPSTPLLIVNPSSINFGSADSSAALSANNGGGGALTVNSVSDNAAWLTVTETDVDADKLGTYTASVSRSGLSDGTYSASITFTSTANTVTVPVIMQVSTGSITADAGYHYVLLLDPQTYETKYQFSAGADSGTYDYAFSSVNSGEYLIIAGSDMNNNNVICDAGEACGAYRTLNDPLTVNINDNLTGLDFPSGFDLSFQEASLPGSSGVSGRITGRNIKRVR